MYLDRDIDEVMRRTRRRPLPGHRVRPEAALRFGYVLGVVAFAFLAVTVNVLAALLALSAIVFYVFVYTMWLKRSTAQNIVIGGAAGRRAGARRLGGRDRRASPGPRGSCSRSIFVWTPPHFWALAMRVREDYAAAGVPMLPVVKRRGRDAAADRRLLDRARGGDAPARPRGGDRTRSTSRPPSASAPRSSGGRCCSGAARRSSARGGCSSYSVLYLGALFGAVAVDALV